MRFGVVACALLVGCAGSDAGDGNPFASDVGPGDSADGMLDGSTGSITTGISRGATSDDLTTGISASTATTGPVSTSGSDDSSSGAESTGSVAGSSSSGDDTTGGSTTMCPNLLTCPMATVLGMVSGDTGADILNASGTEPTWVTFQVTEDNEDVVGEELRFSATLTSPAGYDFDLFVYRGLEGGTTGCGGFLMQSTSSGPTDTVAMQWGEGLVANGQDDDAWVAIEVRVKDDLCGDEEWMLTIEGD